MDRKSHVFLVMIASSLSLAAFVAFSSSPVGFQAVGFQAMGFQATGFYASDLYWAFAVGGAWALMPWAGGLVVTGLNAGFAMARKKNVQFMRDFIWSTGLMMIMVVVATVANI